MMISAKKNLTFLFLVTFIILNLSCNSHTNKNLDYEDYSPDDFYEVIGKVTDNKLSYHIPRKRILFYEYFLDREKPLKGQEENINVYLKKGERFIVLVNKKDSTISFFGYIDPRLIKESFEKFRNKTNENI